MIKTINRAIEAKQNLNKDYCIRIKIPKEGDVLIEDIIQGDVKSEIFDVALTASDTISFEIGSISSTIFDLR